MVKKINKNSKKFSNAAKKAWATRRKLYGPTGTPTKGKGVSKKVAKKNAKSTKATAKKATIKNFKIVSSKNATISSVTVRGRVSK